VNYVDPDSVTGTLLAIGAQKIDSNWSGERIATSISVMYATFMAIRADHLHNHTMAPNRLCPYCSALILGAILNQV
jgi:hypothetical protein